MEVGLQQPMPTHHTEGDGTPLAGQAHTPVTLVSDQPLTNQALNILRRRRRHHAHVLADVFGLDTVTPGLLSAPHELENVLDDR